MAIGEQIKRMVRSEGLQGQLMYGFEFIARTLEFFLSVEGTVIS